MKTSAVFTDLTETQLHAKVEEYNNANVDQGTNWTVKHLISCFFQREGEYGGVERVEYYTLVLERD